MRITYVCRPGAASNDDEGAVEHALTELGHAVTRVDETLPLTAGTLPRCDLLLFNKWCNPKVLERLRGQCVRAVWYWDMVGDGGDPTLARRGAYRTQAVTSVLRHCDVGFFTDGDWVAAANALTGDGRCVWLPQGADGRVVGPGTANPALPPIPVLSVASVRNRGQGRLAFVNDLAARYGDRFHQVHLGVYRRELADLVARASVVVAPDQPSTDRYWSVRVYTVLGFRGNLVHPYCRGLADHYEATELSTYRTRPELYDLVDWALARPDEAREYAEAGYARTVKEHLYRHRCEELCRVVTERFGL